MPHPQTDQSKPRAETWENEGGSIAPELLGATLGDTLGVVRHLTETYSVGGFNYTNLTDAVAQARRMAKLETARP